MKNSNSRCRRTSLLMIFCVFLSMSCWGQTAVSIKGKLTDGTSGIGYGNVVLFDSDTTLITGAVTSMSGDFELKGEFPHRLIMKCSYIGMDTRYIDVVLNEVVTTVAPISLEPKHNGLEEVVVSGKRPVFSMQGGALVTNVKNSTLSSLGNAFDVIEKIPGINIDEDKITVFARGKPIIYINNRRVLDDNELEQLKSSEISSIELLKNPGAKYDAEGRSVLIIKMQKSALNGLAVTLQEQVKAGLYFSHTESADISFTYNKLNLFGSYYQTDKKTKSEDVGVYRLDRDIQWNQEFRMPYSFDFKIYKLMGGFDWEFLPNHSIGAQYKAYKNSSDSHTLGEIHVDADGKDYDNINMDSRKDEQPYKQVMNAFYNAKLTKRFEVQVDFDLSNNHNEFSQVAKEDSERESTRIVRNVGVSDFDLYAAKLTASWSLMSHIDVDFGGEYNMIEGDGYVKNSDALIQSSIYTNNEEKYAGFTSIKADLPGNWSLSAGVRYEKSMEKMKEGVDSELLLDRTYSDLFPSFSISKKIDEKSFSFHVNKRIRRPSFSQLNSGDLYVNRFLVQKGNPFLLDEKIYDFNYQAMFKYFNVSVGYTLVDNPINIGFDYNNEGNYSTLTYKNYDKYENINCAFSIMHKIGWWKPQLSIQVLQPFFSIKGQHRDNSYNKTNVLMELYNEFKLPLDYLLTLDFDYSNEQDYYVTRSAESYRINVGLRRSFFKDRLYLKLQYRDIFDMYENSSITEVDNYYMQINNERETSYLLFTAKLRFNNYQKKYRGRNVSPSDINRL
ncbi:outer membrane beta-barrel protein [Halosquirtibacter xylanolyticus]|uniref:outer membrane beta-barrel family protein n=1 Tax=Halosquirtibacter xylanolyticus TaxID=3374599 RepID=UPI0037495E4E|nr:outer membrane beta-barrel protein [Prolixibacteraceae bacterium]